VAIALALASALVYGASDFFGGLASRRSSTVSVVVWSQLLGFIALAATVAIAGIHASAHDWEYGLLCGVFGTAAIAALYRGLAVGTMGVVSPLSAVLGACIPVLYGVALHGERPALWADAGIVAALLAVICVSAGDTQTALQARTRIPPGVTEGLIAGVMFGAYFIALAQTRPEAGLVPLLAARATSIVLLLAGSIVFARATAIRPERSDWGTIALCGAFDVTANVLFVSAFHLGGMISLVAVLTSLYPAATLALAAMMLHERLRPLQWIGVALALGGAAAIAGS